MLSFVEGVLERVADAGASVTGAAELAVGSLGEVVRRSPGVAHPDAAAPMMAKINAN